VLTVGALVGVFSRRRIGVLAVKPGPAQFSPLAERCARGEIAIRVERTFGLEEVPAALAHVGAGAALGKVVVVP
jgi:NADPH:quinone reductase-like Zn-dependent oxidoreductase